jgi:hypothetical protein
VKINKTEQKGIVVFQEFLKKVSTSNHVCDNNEPDKTLMSYTNPSKILYLLQKLAKVLVAMQVVVHLRVVISFVTQLP